MKSKFSFYEVVKLGKDKRVPPEFVGREAVIMGMASDEQGKWFYAVRISGVEAGWDFVEDVLESTGQFKRREDFYTGDSVKVRVDPITGEGTIVS